ncbi:hypothetical protein PPYR_15029 [Photinus pyralis]|uniref:Glycosyltransferase-like protein LARGE1 n=2 Tax=Photinus pyralis TaxID=7054 RepID=A0A1Y1N4I1_PHOPY|nr:LARGE xylosyl- and glucuronyltransferase 1-like [Photinus pyralis]KAB0790557.1 hypothetical protein PPYR_15029 [Photinus pyralis]
MHFFIIATRHGLILAFLCVIIVLIVINFLSQYSPVFQIDRTIARHKSHQFNKQLLLSQIHNVNIVKSDLVNVFHSTDDIDENKRKHCEVVHVGVVCSGYKSNLYFHTMLKSFYFHSNNPIHFHIMANKISKKVLKTLFDTWAVPQVTVTFYNISEYVADVRWVPNGHYSGIYGLLKLLFPKVVPVAVTNKIIVLDTDLTFVGNIYELWREFDKFEKKQAVGLVENQSEYYLGKFFSSPWPAVGKGFNTGIILYYIDRLKNLDWEKLWIRNAKKTASIFGATRLADQDIMNSVIKQDPNIVYRVHCAWNVQLSDHTQSQECYQKYPIKVVHWNSPKKFNVINPDGEYFRTLYRTFLDLNGDLLKRQLFNCEPNSKNVTEPPIDVCSDFRKASFQKWRTLLFFREYSYAPVKDDVTILVQLSFDRLQLVEELCKYWEGPVSLTFYVTDTELQQTINFIESSDVLKDRSDIAFHAVFKSGDSYPINELRNVGLRQITTPYVFLADADFLTMHDLYSNLKDYISTFSSMYKKALIVPAFESQRYRTSLPKNKKELLQMLNNKSVYTFRYDVWPMGHSPVNYQKWKTASTPYKVKWQPDFEPYIVVRANVTEYDRRFLGFGWNKVSHVMELEAQGYDFIVLPNAFIIHKPHAPSHDIGKFRHSSIYRMCLQNLKEEFVEQLSRKYGRFFDNKNVSLAIGS